MNKNFVQALDFALQFEGGYSNNKNDSGGETMHGITSNVYNAYRQGKGEFSQSVKFITDAEVSDIYYNQYWLKNHCDVLPNLLDIAVFDFSVNAGSEAMKELQTLVGVVPDGIYGAKTMVAVISASSNPNLVNLYLNAHEVFYKNLVKKYPKDSIFLKGWIQRTEKLRGYLA